MVSKNNTFNGNGDSLKSFGNGINSSNNINITSKKVPRYILFVSKYINVILIAEVIIIFLVGYLFLIKPKLDELGEMRQLLKDKNLELQEIQKYQTKSEDLRKSYDQVKNGNLAEIDKLKNILPQEKELPELMAQIEALTISQGLVLGNITINSSSNVSSDSNAKANTVTNSTASSTLKTKTQNQSSGSDLIREIEISVSIVGGDGTYEKVKKLLDAMENHIRLIDITSFSFDEKMTSYSIVFKTYFLKNNEI